MGPARRGSERLTRTTPTNAGRTAAMISGPDKVAVLYGTSRRQGASLHDGRAKAEYHRE